MILGHPSEGIGVAVPLKPGLVLRFLTSPCINSSQSNWLLSIRCGYPCQISLKILRSWSGFVLDGQVGWEKC
jgi:hypothetical protein